MSIRGMFRSTLLGLIRRPVKYFIMVVVTIILTLFFAVVLGIEEGEFMFKVLFVVCMFLARGIAWIMGEHHI